jgi:predicted amidohydrolase YtcJ
LEWYKKETGKDNTSLRLRLEHTTMVTPELIKRIAAAKILSNVEPCGSLSPQHRPGGETEKILGPERFKIHRPLKALFDAGINVNFGSDYPMPYGFIDPRASLFAALDGCGKPWDVITPYQALQAYTINGAYGVYSEDKFGSIEPGKWADFVVFSDNPMTIPKEGIWDPETNTPTDLQVDYTLVAGEIVHQRE